MPLLWTSNPELSASFYRLLVAFLLGAAVSYCMISYLEPYGPYVWLLLLVGIGVWTIGMIITDCIYGA